MEKKPKIIPLIITATICTIILVAAISPLLSGERLSDHVVNLIEKVMMALIAIVSMEIGKNSKDK